ncbi:nuclear apoptosis-inducing factor 1-like [Montipora capricornis]|uniref:nuclear apoptosis-inducing factor 1-like n=1 Tax=Montipora capricornis TaxID=246305 RepID=UPI0035F2012C
MSAEKKSRSARFSQAMSEALVQAYAKHKYVLQAKFSNSVTLEKKKEAWASVLDAVNAVNAGEKKTLEQVKRRWKDMTGTVKKKEREARNKELKRLRVTGNGHLADEDDDLADPCLETLNPAEKEIAHILGPQTFTGIPGGHDSMATFGQTSKGNSEGGMEADMQEVSLAAENICSADVTIKDSKNSAQADNQLGETRKRPAPKTLAQAQLEYFETVTMYYKMKMRKVQLEIDLLKDQKRQVVDNWELDFQGSTSQAEFL